ncbi:hypothetical protein [Oscillibacter sp.]|uniref:hypothetical protein n=1 Tax=Oscillibacter sp. TaxID=1945593 RepID=UPI00339500B2
MALTKFTKDMQVIQSLDDEPNDVGGLTAAELKAKYDEAGEAVKQYINETLTVEIDANKADKSELQDIVLGQIPEGTITKTKLSSEVQALVDKADGSVQESDKATTEEAKAGTDDIKFMTPAKTSDAIAAKKATTEEVAAGTDNTKFVTPASVLQSPAAVTVKDWVEGVRKKLTSRGPYRIRYDLDTLKAVATLPSNTVIVSSLICGDYAVGLLRSPNTVNTSNFDYTVYYCNLSTGAITSLSILSNVSSFSTPYLYPVYGSTDSFICMSGTSGFYVVTTNRTKTADAFSSSSFGYPWMAWKYGTSNATLTYSPDMNKIWALGRSSTTASISVTGATLFHSDDQGVYALVSNVTNGFSASWSVAKYHATSSDNGNTVSSVVCDAIYAISPPAGWTYMGAATPVVKNGFAYILFSRATATTVLTSTVAVCKMNLTTGAYTFSNTFDMGVIQNLYGFGSSDKYVFFTYYGATGVTVYVSLETGEVYKLIQKSFYVDNTVPYYFSGALSRINWMEGIPYDRSVLVGEDFNDVIVGLDDVIGAFCAVNYSPILGSSGGSGCLFSLPYNIKTGIDDPLNRFYPINIRSADSYLLNGATHSFISVRGGSTHVVKQLPCSKVVSLECV